MATENGVPPVRGEQETGKVCQFGVYCRKHGFVHGAEASELRELLKDLQDSRVDAILDDVDARDSLAYVEVLVEEVVEAIAAEEDALQPDLSAPVRAEAATQTRPSTWVDTPLEQAKRKAFDYPTQENLDALIAAASASPVREAEPAQGSPLPLEHARACAALTDEACTCGLAWRVRLVTEQEMHAAWRKRAEEAESAGAREAEPLKALVKAFRTIDVLLSEYSHENSRITAGQTLLEIRHALNGVDLSAALEGAATKGQD